LTHNYLPCILDKKASKRQCPPVEKETKNKERVYIPEMKNMVIKVTVWCQMKGRLGKVRNRKAEEIEAVEMEGGGNYVISVT
jgi:hypothetical protein